MKRIMTTIVLTGMFGAANAADMAAGKEKAEACAACHGANGASVSKGVPNLAAQRAGYIVKQLEAYKDGKRKHPIMKAMAEQLSTADMENVAAYYNGQPGVGGAQVSAVPAAYSSTSISFPSNYRSELTRYTKVNMGKRKQVRFYYANDVALAAAAKGEDLPPGSYLLVEIYKAKMDGGELVKGDDGFFVEDKLVGYTAMENQAGGGDAFAPELRNGGWQYALFKGDRSPRPTLNQAFCLACHKPLTDKSYVFSIEKLRAKARQ